MAKQKAEIVVSATDEASSQLHSVENTAKELSTQIIIAAIRANRGGLENASEQQILTLWRSLDEQTQKQYLETLSERNESHADGNAPE